jgi:ubiquinone/menaquinone biosynthesis C-methylase UbiE
MVTFESYMSWKRKIYYALSPKLRRQVRGLYYFPIDFFEGITGRRDAITPPKGKIFIGPGDFKTIGEKLKNDFIHYGGLQPTHHVLDVGCGIGRIAIPLTSYINAQGSYEGFDIVKEGIEWCQKKITPQFYYFNFKHVDLKNDLYNLDTNQSASEFVFPYEANRFDFVILTSVFTHMQLDDVKQYIKEIARVMKSGATCFATFFILDQESENFLSKQSDPFFKYHYDLYALHDDKVKDANIAYKKDFIKELLQENGLTLKQHHRGWWCGGDKIQLVDFQDVLIIEKP